MVSHLIMNIQIAILLLRASDIPDNLIHSVLNALVLAIHQEVTGCLNPLAHIRVPKQGRQPILEVIRGMPFELVLVEAACFLEVVQLIAQCRLAHNLSSTAPEGDGLYCSASKRVLRVGSDNSRVTLCLVWSLHRVRGHVETEMHDGRATVRGSILLMVYTNVTARSLL